MSERHSQRVDDLPHIARIMARLREIFVATEHADGHPDPRLIYERDWLEDALRCERRKGKDEAEDE